MDNKTVGIKELDLSKAAVKGKDLKKSVNKMIPADRLIRYNFLEFFIRISKVKYIDTKQCIHFDEACLRLLEDYFVPYFSNLDNHIWRKNELWNEKNDKVLKKLQFVLLAVFDKYIDKKKNKKFITAADFMKLLDDCNIFATEFGKHEVMSHYFLSIQTQVDELTSERHL